MVLGIDYVLTAIYAYQDKRDQNGKLYNIQDDGLGILSELDAQSKVEKGTYSYYRSNIVQLDLLISKVV